MQATLDFISAKYYTPEVLSLAVSNSLKNCSLSRDQVADLLSAMLEKRVTVEMLNHYSSEAHEHQMPAVMIKAFCKVTQSTEVIELFLNDEQALIKGKDVTRLELLKKQEKRARLELEIKDLEEQLKWITLSYLIFSITNHQSF